MIISHNLQAMNANRQFNITGKKRAKSTEKLSSGYRINRSADDAAGLAISEKMRRQIRGLSQASLNCQDGISMVQIADGALNEIHDMLHRGTELSVKAANGTLTQEDREYIQKELEQLIGEIDEVANRTTFNEIPVLKGSHQIISGGGNVRVEVREQLPDFVTSPDLDAGHMTGTYSESGKDYIAGTIDFSGVTESNVDQLADTGFNLTCATCSSHYSIRFTEDSESSRSISGEHFIYNISLNGVTNGDELIDKIIAGTQDGNPNGHYTKLTRSEEGKLTAYDIRSNLVSSSTARSNSIMQSGVAYSVIEEGDEPLVTRDIFVQAGAEAGQHIDIELPIISSRVLSLNEVNVIPTMEEDGYDGAGIAIGSFKNALSYVSGERARMGAYQNRLEHTIHNLDNVVENTTAAESAIRDTDMAKEMVAFSNAQILAQTGQSVLAQANQSKQGILSILG